jgi:hypothetical protein
MSEARVIWDWGVKKDRTPRWLRQWRHMRELRQYAGPGAYDAARASGLIVITRGVIMLTVLLVVGAFAGGVYVGVKFGTQELAVAKAELAKIKAKL